MTAVDRLLAALGLATALLMSGLSQAAPAKTDEYTEAIELAIGSWLAAQRPTGFLPYGFRLLADEESEPTSMSGANLTRQAVAAATLADYYASTRDARAAPAIRRQLDAFERHSLPIGKSGLQALVEGARLLSLPFGRYKLRAALEKFGLLYQPSGPGKVLSPRADYREAYTGALALALLTEVRYARASGDDRHAALRRAWLEGLVALRIPGDGFRLLPSVIDATPYFDGEAWLALSEYNRAFPGDRRASELLGDLDTAMLKKYGGPFRIDFFHWGTMAASARFADTRREEFLSFVKAQTRGFLDRKGNHDAPDNNCAWIEGIADALGALVIAGEGDGELAIRARDWAVVEMRRMLGLQIRPDQTGLTFPNASIVAPRMKDFAGSFRAGLYSVDTQIDLTQHCVSAMIKLRRAGVGAR